MLLTFLENKTQITFDDIFNNKLHTLSQTWQMKTVRTNNLTINQKIHAEEVWAALHQLHHNLITHPIKPENINEHYYSFKLPKKTGGYREIDAPKDALKELLTTYKNLFENQMKVLPHNSAYAYVKTRSPLDAIEKHRNNESQKFLKIDFKNFFGSCDKPFIMAQLKKIYPFGALTNKQNYDIIMGYLIDFTLYKGRLPQGTPFSPLLTNLIMVPIDYELTNKLKGFIYTRYADDILISHKESFSFNNVLKIVDHAIHDTPLQINKDKTRYGSRSGRNWNLGLMLNKENNITVGHMNKKKLKAAIDQFLYTPENYSLEEKQKLNGLIAYYRNIEPETINYIIQGYSNKHSKDLLHLLRH